MRNRLDNALQGGVAVRDAADSRLGVDQRPGLRLVFIYAAMVLPLVVTFGRLIQLQTLTPDVFIRDVDRITTTESSLVSRDGRIFASDGQLLAYDSERYDLLVHYRWLEEPPNPRWLRQQAYSRLDHSLRRTSAAVIASEQQVLRQRNRMWELLATVTGRNTDEIATARQEIQSRIERMIEHIEYRRKERAELERREQAGLADGDGSHPWWKQLWNTVHEQLTTPPHRAVDDPIVFAEEQDYHLLLEGIPLEKAAEIESRTTDFPGMRVRVSTERNYPQGDFAAHLIGVRTRISDDQLAARREEFPAGDPLDYQPDNRIGRSGVERTYDRSLRGLTGRIRQSRDASGTIVAEEVIRAPRIGRDITLTLHPRLQRACEALLDEAIGEDSFAGSADLKRLPHGGCLIALRVHDGAILAAATAPRFNLQTLARQDADDWEKTLADPRQPLFPRLTRMTIAPGSVFKTLTAIAVLESGKINPARARFCQGYLDNPNSHRCYIYRHFGMGHGETTLSDAICRSCNVYFFQCAREMGPEILCDWADRLGFGRPTGIDLPGERSGHLPFPPDSDVPQAKDSVWYSGDTLGIAIGQAQLTVTPLQVVRMMAAIANGGYLVTPHVVRETWGSGPGTTASDSALLHPRRKIPGLTEETLAQVRDGLRRVVNDRQGTGFKRVRMKEIVIAGKTGTAEVAGGANDHAWFAGYAPADQPEIAFVAVLQHGGSGGADAGPLARELVAQLLELKILGPTELAQSVNQAEEAAR